MNAGQSSKLMRSEQLVYALGTPYNVKLDFLAPARQMAAPEIGELTFRLSGTVGAITGGVKGRDTAKLFDQIIIRDDEEMVNASGAGLRVLEQVERGSKQTDPADIASGSTNTTFVYRLNLIFGGHTRSVRTRDFRVPLSSLLEGGNITVMTPAAVPTGWAAVQSDWRITVYARVWDARTRELKSRRHIWEQNVSQQEYDYPCFGSIRNAIVTSKLTTTGYTDLSGFTTLFSRTIELPPQFETDMLIDEYRKGAEAIGTNDEFTLAANGAIPIKIASRYQKIGQMIDARTLHLDLRAAAPTGGRLLLDVVTDRSPTMAALQMGYESPSSLAAAVKARGVVVGEAGNIPAREMVATLARRTPIRIK